MRYVINNELEEKQMIYRRIKAHIEKENWFAVCVDFFIVVVGILIAFQVTNWNEARQAKISERIILKQLESEFAEIKAELEKQLSIRSRWINELKVLIQTLEGSVEEDEFAVKTALASATATGRRPAQSAAYLQLMAGDGLDVITNEQVRQALVSYDVRLERDAFIHPALMRLVTEEMSSNPFVDMDVVRLKRNAAAIDQKEGSTWSSDNIRSYDLEGLRTLENRYESMYVFHLLLLTSDEDQLNLANQILKHISKEVQ